MKSQRAVALMIGLEGEELEDLRTKANPRFWETVESRRRSENTVRLAEVRRRLEVSKKVKGGRRKGRTPCPARSARPKRCEALPALARRATRESVEYRQSRDWEQKPVARVSYHTPVGLN